MGLKPRTKNRSKETIERSQEARRIARSILNLSGPEADRAQAQILRTCGAVRRAYSYGGPRHMNRDERRKLEQLAAAYERTANLINEIPADKKYIFEQALPTPDEEDWGWEDEAQRLKTLGRYLKLIIAETPPGRSGEDNERLRIVATNAYTIWVEQTGTPPGKGHSNPFQNFVCDLFELSGGKRENIVDIRAAITSALKGL